MSLETSYPKKTVVTENKAFEEGIPVMDPVRERPSQDYSVPTQIIDLPSKGFFYPADHPLAEGKIEIKAMTAKEEDILTTESFINSGVVLDKFFESMIVTPFDYNTILTGDKTAIMLAARISAYGSDYEFTVQSPTGKKIKQTVDLSTFEPKEVDFTDLTPNENCIKFTLPASGAELEIKILTHKDEIYIEREISRRKKHGQRDPSLSVRLKQHILSIDGNRRSDFIHKFVENQLLVADSKALRSFIQRTTPDIDLSLEIYDDDLDEPFRTSLPFGPSFFWPET